MIRNSVILFLLLLCSCSNPFAPNDGVTWHGNSNGESATLTIYSNSATITVNQTENSSTFTILGDSAYRIEFSVSGSSDYYDLSRIGQDTLMGNCTALFSNMQSSTAPVLFWK